MKRSGIFLSVLLLASCGADMGKGSAASKGLTDAGKTVHLKGPRLLTPVENVLDGLSFSARYQLSRSESVGGKGDIVLPKGQALTILKYRNFLVNEGGPERGAVGVVKGGPHAGVRFVYRLSDYGPVPELNAVPWY